MDDFLAAERRNMYEPVHTFSKPVCLIQDEWTSIFAIGWSRSDILVEVRDENGEVVASNAPLGGFMTHAPETYFQIDKALLKSLWRNRPPESDIPALEDKWRLDRT